MPDLIEALDQGFQQHLLLLVFLVIPLIAMVLVQELQFEVLHPSLLLDDVGFVPEQFRILAFILTQAFSILVLRVLVEHLSEVVTSLDWFITPAQH